MNQDLKYFKKRLAQLDVAYQEYVPIWRELADYYLPRTCKFLVSDANKRPKFSKKIVDSSSGIAVRNFASGMMSGATNPAQKWFKLGIHNYKNKDFEVKQWCSAVSELIRDVFNSSNLYNHLPNCYMQMGVFAISIMVIEKDYDDIINCKVLPIGSYKIARNHKGKVVAVYRCYSDTVGSIVDKFGIENVSSHVREQYERENYESSIEIVHAVEPNKDYNKDSKFAVRKKYISVYFEAKSKDGKFLNKSGFNHFPFVVFDASLIGEDVYPSDCPGITALPDVKQVMKQVIDLTKAKQKIVSPTLTGPAKNKKTQDNPGTYIPQDETSTNRVAAVYQVDPRILAMDEAIEKLKKIIGQIFYNDLFAMLTNSDFTQPRTATELNMRKEEALVLLSPFLQQVHTGLKQLLDITFEYLTDFNLVPEPPKQIQGKEINIEFISTLAQAMKAALIGAMERFTTFVSNISATVEPNARMKIDWFEVIDDYADFANIEPDNIVPTESVLLQMQEIAKQQQAQQQMAALQQGSEIIKNMGGADASGGNLMERIGLQ